MINIMITIMEGIMIRIMNEIIIFSFIISLVIQVIIILIIIVSIIMIKSWRGLQIKLYPQNEGLFVYTQIREHSCLLFCYFASKIVQISTFRDKSPKNRRFPRIKTLFDPNPTAFTFFPIPKDHKKTTILVTFIFFDFFRRLCQIYKKIT